MTAPRHRPGLLIRADTRPGVGAGHAMRQLALAERWSGGRRRDRVAMPRHLFVPAWRRGRCRGRAGDPDDGLRALAERAGDRGGSAAVLDGYHFAGACRRRGGHGAACGRR